MKTLMFAVLTCLAGVASATTPAAPTTSIPNGDTTPQTNPYFYGANTLYLELNVASNTAVQLASGSGFLYGVEDSSGTLGDYCQFFDSATTAGITVGTLAHAVTPQVFTGVEASSSSANIYFGTGIAGKYEPAGLARRFKNGLVGIKAGPDSNNNCYVSVLLDSVIQAAPQTH